jgi:hypothetical protein
VEEIRQIKEQPGRDIYAIGWCHSRLQSDNLLRSVASEFISTLRNLSKRQPMRRCELW